MANQFLNLSELKDFNVLQARELEPAIDETLASHQAIVNQCLQQANPTYENFIAPIEDKDQILHSIWSLASHLNNVVSNTTFREAYNRCLPKITAYYTQLGQNSKLYQGYLKIKQNTEFKNLSVAQQKIITNAIRDFELAGVALTEDKKQKFAQINEALANLSNQYEENLLDATDAWRKHIKDVGELAGLPEDALIQAQAKAQEEKLTGYLLTLEFPCYHAVMTYAQKRELREEMYRAYATRASDLSDNKKFDNSKLMDEIVKLRHQQANLVGFNNYAEYSLATKDAESPKKVMDFLQALVDKTHAKAQEEFIRLKQYAKDNDGLADLQAWDVAFYSEKYKQAFLSISDEELRPYFPEEKVLQGLFTIVEQLYAIKIKPAAKQKLWHADASYYEIYDDKQTLIAGFYLDLYARAKKRGGAWMDNFKDKHQFLSGETQLPLAFLTCNFNSPTGDKPALLNHEEVLTIFHEFGHGLHQMLTQIDYAGVAGVNGVAWDVVEFPSQFMENFCWQPETLKLMSGHYQTNEALPDALMQRLIALKKYQAAMQVIRQLEFALFDFRLHLQYDAENPQSVQAVLDAVRAEVSVVPVAKFNRFQHGFSHIFGGGYAAGYYSYKWAEVFAADAFKPFLQQGILDAKVGKLFLEKILSQGGAKEMMDMYVDFCGHKPNINTMLELYGLQ